MTDSVAPVVRSQKLPDLASSPDRAILFVGAALSPLSWTWMGWPYWSGLPHLQRLSGGVQDATRRKRELAGMGRVGYFGLTGGGVALDGDLVRLRPGAALLLSLPQHKKTGHVFPYMTGYCSQVLTLWAKFSPESDGFQWRTILKYVVNRPPPPPPILTKRKSWPSTGLLKLCRLCASPRSRIYSKRGAATMLRASASRGCLSLANTSSARRQRWPRGGTKSTRPAEQLGRTPNFQRPTSGGTRFQGCGSITATLGGPCKCS